MLTARDAASDVFSSLDAGADDYLAKPFSFAVLLARIRALGRRGPAIQEVRLQIADLAMDLGARSVVRDGEVLALTRPEFNLLEHLMRHGGRVVTRQSLTDALWGSGRQVESNTLDAFVKSLRQKVEAGGRARLIHTIRGVGFSVREEPRHERPIDPRAADGLVSGRARAARRWSCQWPRSGSFGAASSKPRMPAWLRAEAVRSFHLQHRACVAGD
jgi:DNA-binding winged helix-turn-helix (wHTH) protein